LPTYLLINASWSLDEKYPATSVATFLLLALIIHPTRCALFATGSEYLRPMGFGFIVGYGLAAAIVAIEAVFDCPCIAPARSICRASSSPMQVIPRGLSTSSS
jgi:hypothetical protein